MNVVLKVLQTYEMLLIEKLKHSHDDYVTKLLTESLKTERENIKVLQNAHPELFL